MWKVTEAILAYLQMRGVDAGSIQVDYEFEKADAYKFAELADEHIFVKFDLPGTNGLIYYTDTTYSPVSVDYPQMNIHPATKADTMPVKLTGKVLLSGKQILSFDDKASNLQFPPNMKDMLAKGLPVNLDFQATARDAEGKTKDARIGLIFKPDKEIIYRNESYRYFAEKDTTFGSAMPLAFYKFDGTNPNAFNQSEIDSVKDALSAGKSIELLPFTDWYGTEDHNLRLARLRAESALKLLGPVPENQYEIIIREGSPFPNELPMGRMLNRSVYVRIK
jgi:outer membrane protein OmpA-like peptidoglycan-associated protein